MNRQLHRMYVVTLLAVASLGFIGATISGASTTKVNDFTLTGQAKGTLTLNSSETCASGNIAKSDGVTTVRIYLSDHDLKPTKDLWYLLFEVKSLKVSFPAAYPTTLTLGANSGASIAEEWSAGTTGSGTVSFAKGYMSGSMSVSLPPAPGQKGATRVEKIVGTWSCK
jgi:hypothetical protein